jgi:hypothetical protein
LVFLWKTHLAIAGRVAWWRGGNNGAAAIGGNDGKLMNGRRLTNASISIEWPKQ